MLFPPGSPLAHPDRGGHRQQRQDDHRADDRPHLQGDGPQGRHDQHRWHLRRRPPRSEGRHERPASPPRRCCRTRHVDFAVFEVARGGILREGLGYDRNDVAVVLNVTGDHLGLGGITSLRQLAAVKQVLVEAVPRDGTAVLNADDPLVAAMGRHCSGSVIYFSLDPNNETVARQASRGRRAVTVEPGRNGEMIVLRQGRKKLPAGLDPPPAGHLRGARTDERAERAGCGRRRLGRRRSPPRHPRRGCAPSPPATSWRPDASTCSSWTGTG